MGWLLQGRALDLQAGVPRRGGGGTVYVTAWGCHNRDRGVTIGPFLLCAAGMTRLDWHFLILSMSGLFCLLAVSLVSVRRRGTCGRRVRARRVQSSAA